MTQAAQDHEFQSRMRQLDGLLQEVESIEDLAAREKTTRIIQGLMDFHGAALACMFDQLSEAGDAGAAIVSQLANDELTGSLLLLYGLHPQDLPTRVRGALEKVRPYLASHGGNVELLSVSEEGVVRLVMQGSCHGCPSSAITLKTSIEQAIYERAPDVTAIEVEQEPAAAAEAAPAGFVPVERVTASAAAHHSREGVSV